MRVVTWVFIAALAFYKHAQPRLKRIAAIAPIYAALFIVFALWNEVRLLFPLLVLALPVALSFIDTQYVVE